jgi:hypothetical protein
MQTQILITDEYAEWFGELTQHQRKAVRRIVAMLEMMGVTLPFPYSSAIEGTDYPIRELRIKAKGDQIRVLYAFDPIRRAVLLVGGDKTGDDRFYDRLIPIAERLWEQHLDTASEGPEST